MVVDLVIPEDGETLKEAHDKWRRWAEAKVRILRLNILHGGHSMGSTISREDGLREAKVRNLRSKILVGDTRGEALIEGGGWRRPS
jgi:hypothetical protein